MKRKALSLLFTLLLLSSLVMNVCAASNLPMVIDDAKLLADEERIALEEKSLELRRKYEMDVVILTVDSLHGANAQNYADGYFDNNGYGFGENENGILFLLAMAEREWYISTCGDVIYTITDYDAQQLGDAVVSYLSAGDYYDAFDAYLDALPGYLEANQDTPPMQGHADYSREPYQEDRENGAHYSREHSPNIFLSLLIGVIAAAAAVLIMRFSMNTKRQQHGASSYLKAGSFRLRTHQDMFLYSNVSKVRRQQNNGGGGSSAHRSSGGRRHGGGGGRF